MQCGSQRTDQARLVLAVEVGTIEQQPWPSSAAGSGRTPRQPRPQIQVQFEVRNERSKRQLVPPSVISISETLIASQPRGAALQPGAGDLGRVRVLAHVLDAAPPWR